MLRIEREEKSQQLSRFEPLTSWFWAKPSTAELVSLNIQFDAWYQFILIVGQHVSNPQTHRIYSNFVTKKSKKIIGQ